jgi:hypothetical protein
VAVRVIARERVTGCAIVEVHDVCLLWVSASALNVRIRARSRIRVRSRIRARARVNLPCRSTGTAHHCPNVQTGPHLLAWQSWAAISRRSCASSSRRLRAHTTGAAPASSSSQRGHPAVLRPNTGPCPSLHVCLVVVSARTLSQAWHSPAGASWMAAWLRSNCSVATALPAGQRVRVRGAHALHAAHAVADDGQAPRDQAAVIRA